MSLTGSCFSSESALGALPPWDSKTRRNDLLGGLAVGRTTGPRRHANSPHPSSREGHHSTAGWFSSFLLLDLILHGPHASLIGRLGSSTFRLSTATVVDVAHGLVLLFGIGTRGPSTMG